MPQTLSNGVTVPINADAYNLAADLATMGNSSNVIITVASQAARDALTATAGMTVCRTDLPGAPLQTYDGTTWSDTLQYSTVLSGTWQGSGNIYATQLGTRLQVVVDISVTRTGSSYSAVVGASFSGLGTILPSAVIGSSPIKYAAGVVSGAAASQTIHLALNPTDGSISVRFLTSFTWPVNALTSFNCTYFL